MSERYRILQHNTDIFKVADCPLILVSHALTKDNQTGNIILQCRFENVGSKGIKALNIDVLCSDITNQKLEGVENYSYLDIEVAQYQTFGDKTPVYLPDKATRNLSIIPTRLVFVDGSIWENKSSTSFKLLDIPHKPLSELGVLSEQYKRDLRSICMFSDKHKWLPAHADGYIFCGCGKVVADTAKSCPVCGVEFTKLFSLNDADKLQAGLEQYKKEQAEQEEKQRQEKIKRENELKLKQQKQRKIIRKYTKIGGAIVIAGLVIFGAYSVISHITYQNAFQKAQQATNMISAGSMHSLGLNSDGSVVVNGENSFGRCNVGDWENIKSIFAGSMCSVGLRSDGTVVAVGDNDDGQCDVSGWKDIVAISAGDSYSLGLKSDGTVVATGNNDDGQCEVSNWDLW